MVVAEQNKDMLEISRANPGSPKQDPVIIPEHPQTDLDEMFVSQADHVKMSMSARIACGASSRRMGGVNGVSDVSGVNGEWDPRVKDRFNRLSSNRNS